MWGVLALPDLSLLQLCSWAIIVESCKVKHKMGKSELDQCKERKWELWTLWKEDALILILQVGKHCFLHTTLESKLKN